MNTTLTMDQQKVHEGEYMKQWLDSRRIKVAEVAELTGISDKAIYKNLKKQILPASFKEKLTNAKLSIFQPTQPVNEDFLEKSLGLVAKNLILPPEPLPVYDVWGQSGVKTIKNAMKNQLILTHLSIPGAQGCAGGIFMKGDFMAPRIKHNEILTIKEIAPIAATKIDFGDIYYLEFDDGRDPLVRYLRQADHSKWLLRCHNGNYDDVVIDPISVTALYKIEMVVRYV